MSYSNDEKVDLFDRMAKYASAELAAVLDMAVKKYWKDASTITTPSQETDLGGLSPSEYNPVNKPAHYIQGRKYEPVDVIEDWKLDFNLGNALKYISRAGRKTVSVPAEVQDLEKAIFYINRRIQALSKL